jgi:hypothetical protein
MDAQARLSFAPPVAETPEPATTLAARDDPMSAGDMTTISMSPAAHSTEVRAALNMAAASAEAARLHAIIKDLEHDKMVAAIITEHDKVVAAQAADSSQLRRDMEHMHAIHAQRAQYELAATLMQSRLAATPTTLPPPDVPACSASSGLTGYGPSTPTSPARSSSTCARIDQVDISPTLRPSPRTSMTFSSFSSSTTAKTVSSSSGPSRLSLSRGQPDDHRDRPTSSQPGSSDSGASRRPISSPTKASLSQNSTRHVRRRRRNFEFRSRPFCGHARPSAPTRGCASFDLTAFYGPP